MLWEGELENLRWEEELIFIIYISIMSEFYKTVLKIMYLFELKKVPLGSFEIRYC